MLHGWKAIVLLAALGSCRPATAGEPITLNGHRGGVYCVSFSPDGRTIATGSLDANVKLWTVPAR